MYGRNKIIILDFYIQKNSFLSISQFLASNTLSEMGKKVMALNKKKYCI